MKSPLFFQIVIFTVILKEFFSALAMKGNTWFVPSAREDFYKMTVKKKVPIIQN